MYALIEFAGKQFKVEDGSKIKVPYISSKVGEKVACQAEFSFVIPDIINQYRVGKKEKNEK